MLKTTRKLEVDGEWCATNPPGSIEESLSYTVTWNQAMLQSMVRSASSLGSAAE
jgi:hypothetical protein